MQIVSLSAEPRPPRLAAVPPEPEPPLAITAPIGLSSRLITVLANAGIETYGQLAIIPDSELLQIPNLGYAALREIRETLRKLGLARQEALASRSLERRRTALEQELWDLTAPAGGVVERGIAMVHFGWDGRLGMEQIRNRYRVRRDLLRSIFLAVETQPPPRAEDGRAIRVAASFIASHTPLWIKDAEELLIMAGLSRQRVTLHGLMEACRIGGLTAPFALVPTPEILAVRDDHAEPCRAVVRSVQHLVAIRGTTTVDEVKECSEKILGRELDRKFVRRSIALLSTIYWIDDRLGVVTARP